MAVADTHSFSTNRFSTHHVGARDGGDLFPNRSFEADMVSVLYEADATCKTKIEYQNRHSGAAVHMLPFALGRRDGRAPFYITRSPYGSSLYKPALMEFDFYGCAPSFDACSVENTRIAREIEVDVRSLDSLYAEQGNELPPPPDFFSMDTQGSEADIIEGASQTLRAHTVAVVAEVEFQEVYRGQALFGDVQSQLRDLGFVFARFLSLPEMAPHRGPVGFRGDGFHVYGDALFLRRPRDILSGGMHDSDAALCKLIFASLAFNQVEFARSVASFLRPLDADEVDADDALAYERFVSGFRRLCTSASAGATDLYPLTFTERYGVDATAKMFEVNDFDAAAYFEPEARQRLEAERPSWEELQRAETTEIERYLRSNGFDITADVLRTNRTRHARDAIAGL